MSTTQRYPGRTNGPAPEVAMTTTSGFEDEEIALSINSSHTRRGSARSPSEQAIQHDPMQSALASTQRQSNQNTELGRSHGHGRSIEPTRTANVTRLGQYRVLNTLGEGSFGKVKLAIHEGTRQHVALKIISRRKLMARDMVGRVEREIQYLQLLRHPHIIKLYAVITTDKEIVMVLEYAGKELFNYIVEHGKMVEDKARGFFQQIVCAVEYCHRHKIVHRDLKPENLLLDDNLHVKIADFGLSNIMTDGNFLKTSCGSPNYAAPEVISGKLYAGPEVDVWSCGVILYVLLVGKLPFDDEYIPALFKKIAQGNYQIPKYVSKGAADLVKKMLQVNVVNRISIQEIRQDPWFLKNLPDYLKPPVEEFVDTGVDPNKAIDPRSLAPTKSPEVAEQLHNSVIGKLGKTMGYGREDVQQALAVDEPNAIKDAYLIVRENQIMRDTPSMAQDPQLQPFLATSPTQEPQSPISSINETLHALPPRTSMERPRHSSEQKQQQPRSPGGKIAVLPSSLPDYHKLFMSGRPTVEKQPADEDDLEARKRALNPHSRSIVGVDKLAHVEEKKERRRKATKWQFGIRSRNPPAEAMLAIYRALKSMGADWEVPTNRRPGEFGEHHPQRHDEGSITGSSDEGSEESSSETLTGHRNGSVGLTGSPLRGRQKKRRYGSWNDWGYGVPVDPWIINARFKKGEMFPPGAVHPSSAHSSAVDLQAANPSDHADGGIGSAQEINTSAIASLDNSENSSKTIFGAAAGAAARSEDGEAETKGDAAGAKYTPAGQLTQEDPVVDDSAHIYLTIQLYALGNKDQEMYVVDFKCAGYERLVRRLVRVMADDDALVGIEDNHPATDPEDHSRHVDKYFETDDDHLPTSEHAKEFASGRPKEGGNWEALKQRQGSAVIEHKARQDSRDDPDPRKTEARDFAATETVPSEGAGSRTHWTDTGSVYEEEFIGDGRAIEEKDVSSPFPFLDVAARLIIQLAEAS